MVGKGGGRQGRKREGEDGGERRGGVVRGCVCVGGRRGVGRGRDSICALRAKGARQGEAKAVPGRRGRARLGMAGKAWPHSTASTCHAMPCLSFSSSGPCLPLPICLFLFLSLHLTVITHTISTSPSLSPSPILHFPVPHCRFETMRDVREERQRQR